MTSNLPLRLIIAVFAILTLGFSAGCSGAKTSVSTDTPPTSIAAPSETAPATPTAEPASIWLVADSQVSDATRQEFSAWLAARASEDGYRFLEVAEFRQSEVPAHLKAVVILSPGVDVGNLAAAMPETQFVVVTSSELPPAVNLSVIQSMTNQAAFLAGYLTILNAPDFRAGGLFVDEAAGGELQESFLNGGRYLCGRCSPVFTPLVTFPLTGKAPAGSGAAAWQAAFDTLHQNRIEMLYIQAAGLTPEFLDYLADKNIGILSDAPPPPGFDSNWVATVRSNPLSALEILWPDILAGSGGQTAAAGLEISNVNPNNLSTGRLELAEKLIPDLTGGLIAPLAVP